jgi:hypothetical protein
VDCNGKTPLFLAILACRVKTLLAMATRIPDLDLQCERLLQDPSTRGPTGIPTRPFEFAIAEALRSRERPPELEFQTVLDAIRTVRRTWALYMTHLLPTVHNSVNAHDPNRAFSLDLASIVISFLIPDL